MTAIQPKPASLADTLRATAEVETPRHTEDCDGPDGCRLASCDCCSRSVPSCHIAQVKAFGIETDACLKCRDEEEPA